MAKEKKEFTGVRAKLAAYKDANSGSEETALPRSGITVQIPNFLNHGAWMLAQRQAKGDVPNWSMRDNDQQQANSTNKRGIIVDRDPAKMRVKVRFDDEDGMVSAWIDVLAKSTIGTQTFMMPAMGEEVWCAMDAKGEDGCITGSKYNSQNPPPHSSNDDIGLVWADGFVHVNTGSGAVTVNTSGPLKIIASAIELESATLTHNGTDISDQHKHGGIKPGPSNTGTPV